MSAIKQGLKYITTALAAAALLAGAAFALPSEWAAPGNTDLNILNGGVMLSVGDEYYYSQDGIYRETEEGSFLLSEERAANLNLRGESLVYTLGDGTVRSLPLAGGEAETIFKYDAPIKQLYVTGESLLFLSGGGCFSYDPASAELTALSAPADVQGLIPTEYGNIFLTGETLSYDLYAGESLCLSNVTSAYTDSGYLVVNRAGETLQASLSGLFAGDADFTAYSLHGDVLAEQIELCAHEEGDGVCEVCEANADAPIEEYDPHEISLLTNGEPLITPEVSDGQRNIVRRARQLAEVQWTPLEDRYSWRQNTVFTAGTTYTGVPYGQAVYTGYVGWALSVSEFVAAVNDNTSKFYSGYSTYTATAPYYSSDCSGFASYAWGTPYRCTCTSMLPFSTYIGKNVYDVQIGDVLNNPSSHVVVVTDVGYDADGNMVMVEITEETPPKTKVTVYGQGGSRSLSSLQSSYLNGGYSVYRFYKDELLNRDNVIYTPDPAVPLEGDDIVNAQSPVPSVSVAKDIGSKTLTLTHNDADAVIYYTTDGSAPDEYSAVYSRPITTESTITVKAAAIVPGSLQSFTVTYKLSVPPAAAPEASAVSGLMNGEYVSAGSYIKLSSDTSGATVYYTTDGSEPTTSSAVYSSPIAIKADTRIRAIAIAKGCTVSAESSFDYKIGQVYTITASAGVGGSVSPSGSAQVIQTSSKTYVIKANSVYKIKDVLVDGVSVGAVSSYTFSDLSANHTLEASFLMNVALPFTDVASSAWYYGPVGYAYANELFEGTADKSFSPGVTMNRAMFITVLGRLAGYRDILENWDGSVGITYGTDVSIRKEASSSSTKVAAIAADGTPLRVISETTGADGKVWYGIQYKTYSGYIRSDLVKLYNKQYSDIGAGGYYSAYVKWASLTPKYSSNCVLTNIAGGSTFSPLSDINREEMALVLYNYARAYDKELDAVNDKTTFADDGRISSAAKDAVYALQRAGVIDGMEGNLYSPKDSANRAQVAKIFMYFAEAIG